MFRGTPHPQGEKTVVLGTRENELPGKEESRSGKGGREGPAGSSGASPFSVSWQEAAC